MSETEVRICHVESFRVEDGDRRFLRNVGNDLPESTKSHPKMKQSS
jgi:hypothetical protein